MTFNRSKHTCLGASWLLRGWRSLWRQVLPKPPLERTAQTRVGPLRSARLLHCSVIPGLLARHSNTKVCTYPRRWAPQTRQRTLDAPVPTFRAYSIKALGEVAPECVF